MPQPRREGALGPGAGPDVRPATPRRALRPGGWTLGRAWAAAPAGPRASRGCRGVRGARPGRRRGLTFWRIWPDVDTLRMSFCGEPGSASGSLSDDSSGGGGGGGCGGAGGVEPAAAAAMLPDQRAHSGWGRGRGRGFGAGPGLAGAGRGLGGLGRGGLLPRPSAPLAGSAREPPPRPQW